MDPADDGRWSNEPTAVLRPVGEGAHRAPDPHGELPTQPLDPANAPTVHLPLVTPRPQVVADAPVVEETVRAAAA